MPDIASLYGTPLFNGPGEYGDENDMARRREAGTLADLIYKNPNMPRGTSTPGYLAEGLSYDNEGLLSAYALKFGREKAMQLMQALPHMGREDLIAVEKAVASAGREYNAMNEREVNTYRRNDPNFFNRYSNNMQEEYSRNKAKRAR